jgi:hypothetical protein
MKYAVLLTLSVTLFSASCNVQSGITQKSLENYQPTPTPEKIARPTEEPIDPAHVVNADTSTEGPNLSVNRETDKTNINCNKYNRVTINASGLEVKIVGACSRIMVNGRQNRITAVAATEITAFGQNNTIEYTKYLNGKKPVITDSSGTNTISKVEAADPKAAPANTKR